MSDLPPSSVVAVLTTAPDLETAERLGRTLVEERLVACANLLPGALSIFRWEDDVQREAEVVMILKTTGERVEAARARLVDLHPYDVPEVVTLPVAAGHGPYLEWVRSEVGG